MAVYLDYAAATPVDEQVLVAMQPYFARQFANPSANYEPARSALAALNQARSDVAGVLGAKSTEIIFTAGATEANNLALFGVTNAHQGAKVVTTAIEHESVIEPLKKLGTKVTFVKPESDGIVDPDKIAAAIDDETVLVSVMYANNEVGTVQPVKKIANHLVAIRKERARKGVKTPLYFHSDAAQAANYLDMHVHRLGLDLMTINGGKIYGPKQSGALFVRSGVELEPLIYGGGQERGLRSGTENVAGAVGLAKALQLASELRHVENDRLSALNHEFAKKLAELVPDLTINGSKKHRLPNNLHVTIPGQDNERLLMALDSRGIYAAAGSACSASNDEPSHVLTAMGLPDPDIRSSIRFSMGRQTTSAEFEITVRELRSILA